ncbi:MAG TPA: hypothetical protein VFP59_11455 [Candidatus Angelobacter sp.]|nr:hypothetical protein [Candidatus Angelobacter sp.]
MSRFVSGGRPATFFAAVLVILIVSGVLVIAITVYKWVTAISVCK